MVAHEGQFRNDGGTPYITHPIAVAEMANTETEKCVALLHDVLEDTFIVPQQLRCAYGLPGYICSCVEILTHRKDESYLDYILRIRENYYSHREAIIVKLADIAHNSLTCSKTMRDKYDLARYILTH